MKRISRIALTLFACMLMFAGQALAKPATYIVLPFAVQASDASYKSLEKSIPQMLTSRLYADGQAVPARELPASLKPVTGTAQAESLRAKYKADYVVWGTANIIGEDASLDVRVKGKGAKVWANAREAKAQQIMGAIRDVSSNISTEVFGVSPSSAARASRGSTGIVRNQTSQDVYLNPNLRYAGSSGDDDARLRSQQLKFASIGMEVVDGDGDGKNEIFLLADRTLYAYVLTGKGELIEKAKYQFPIKHKCLSVRSLPRSGKPWIIINAIDQKNAPSGVVLTYNGKAFKEEIKNVSWYMNVVRLAPSYNPTLIGQMAAPPRLFKPDSMSELMKQGDKLVAAKRISLPKDANVFNFTHLPASRGEKSGDKLVVLGNTEKLRVYNNKNTRLAETSETYSGSAVGMEIDPSLPGLGQDTITIASMFYIPMRMIASDIENDGKWELIVNRPVSTASQIFDRYRDFPQSEIHSLFWDGMGLNLQWKTRRIKGSMADYALADANNDGVLDLVTCINTHPGALGVKARKTVVMLYPLDTSLSDPNTATYKGDIQE